IAAAGSCGGTDRQHSSHNLVHHLNRELPWMQPVEHDWLGKIREVVTVCKSKPEVVVLHEVEAVAADFLERRTPQHDGRVIEAVVPKQPGANGEARGRDPGDRDAPTSAVAQHQPASDAGDRITSNDEI